MTLIFSIYQVFTKHYDLLYNVFIDLGHEDDCY